MSREDWFRNISWDADIEAAFYKKLSRARDKSQYLRIQAHMIADKYPAAALQLLQQYFLLGNKFDNARAYDDQATAYLALGNIEAAITAYEASLARQAEFPQLRTQSYLWLPLLIVTRSLKARFDQAMSILEANRDQAMFPVDRFHWNALRAIILTESGDALRALDAANAALSAAAEVHSGFHKHPTIGLVGERQETLFARVSAIAGKLN
ncbi:MAG: hypothetical protein K2Q06_14310 [Parvularculaceae bacterium]|nr:hypothetical protein [Parvularculaceae bacterium]